MSDLVTLERWKVVLAVGMSLILGLLIGFLVERARVHSGPVATIPTPTPSPTATAAPTQTPVPSASATASSTPTPATTPTATAAPTPAPTLAAPPSIGNGSAVLSQSGTRDGGPYPVAVSLKDNWGLAYSFLCSGGNGQFNLTVLSGGSPYPPDPPFAAIGSNVQGAQGYAKGGSALQLQVRIGGSCQWRFSVYNNG